MGYDSLDASYDISQYARGATIQPDSTEFISEAGDMIMTGLGVFLGFVMIISLIITIIQVIAMWKLFSKAGQKGWKSIIPIYSSVILFRIAKISPWLLLLYLTSFIPFIGWAVVIALNAYFAYNLAKSFGKDGAYAVGLFFLPLVFYMILAFDKSEYIVGGANTVINETTE